MGGGAALNLLSLAVLVVLPGVLPPITKTTLALLECSDTCTGVCSLYSAVVRPDCHLFVCCRCLTTKLLSGSCLLLFCHDGWGTPFTWAKSGLRESAVPWLRRFTRSHGLHYLSQEWHIRIEECGGCTIWSMLYEITHRKNVRFWVKEIWRVTKLTKATSPLALVVTVRVFFSPLGVALYHFPFLSPWSLATSKSC